MYIASQVVLVSLESDKRDAAGALIFPTLDEAAKAAIRTSDLEIIRNPYVLLGIVVVLMMVVISFVKMPEKGHTKEIRTGKAFKNLFANKVFREGVIAQMFYVAAQIMCWTFIIQYAGNLGITKADAQLYNIAAMIFFLSSRFIATFLMKYVNSRKLLMLFGMGGILTISGTIFIGGMFGLYCLIATSAFMSLMFPTIYGIALEDVKEEDSTMGAALLVMSIVGGALCPPLQGAIIDMGTVGSMPAVNFSFILPLICFVVIAGYGYRSYKLLDS